MLVSILLTVLGPALTLVSLCNGTPLHQPALLDRLYAHLEVPSYSPLHHRGSDDVCLPGDDIKNRQADDKADDDPDADSATPFAGLLSRPDDIETGTNLCAYLETLDISCAAIETLAHQPERNLKPKHQKKCTNCNARCLKSLRDSDSFIRCLQICTRRYCRHGRMLGKEDTQEIGEQETEKEE